MTRPLTPRQIDVIRLVAEGLSSATIGRQLHITEDTVKTVLRRAYARLGAVSRAHAVHLAYQTGVLTVTQERSVREWSDIAYEMWAMLCNSTTDGHSSDAVWNAARDRLRDRFHSALAKEWPVDHRESPE